MTDVRPEPTTASIDARVEPYRAEQLARIGVLLDAQRVEIYQRSTAPDHLVDDDGGSYRLLGWWTALGMDPAPPFDPDWSVPARWFPWSVGNLRPIGYLLVSNAEALGLHPSSPGTIGALGLRSCLHVPVRSGGGRLLGAACVYWRDSTESWPEKVTGQVSELALAALGRRPRRRR